MELFDCNFKLWKYLNLAPSIINIGLLRMSCSMLSEEQKECIKGQPRRGKILVTMGLLPTFHHLSTTCKVLIGVSSWSSDLCLVSGVAVLQTIQLCFHLSWSQSLIHLMWYWLIVDSVSTEMSLYDISLDTSICLWPSTAPQGWGRKVKAVVPG